MLSTIRISVKFPRVKQKNGTSFELLSIRYSRLRTLMKKVIYENKLTL